MTECPCEREPPLPAPPAPSTAPPATNPSPSPVPLGAPIPTDCIPTEPSEEEEVEMLDWDESDDDGGKEDDPTAIDADDDATPPDLCDAPANPAAGSRSTSPKPRHGGSATVGLASTLDDTPPPPAMGGSNVEAAAQAQARDKSVKARAPTLVAAPAPLAGRRKHVWRRLELPGVTAAAPLEQRALRSKAPSSQKGKAIYSPPAKPWERGECSNATAQGREPLSPKWQVSKKKYWWRRDPPPSMANSERSRRSKERHPPAHPWGRGDYKERLAGRCFRCLGSDHQVAQCRDPLRCLRCRGTGHTSKLCPTRSRQPISSELRSRLVFPAGSIHSRLVFPELCPPKVTKPPPPPTITSDLPQSPPQAAEMEHVPGQAAFRPALGRVNIVATESMAAEAGCLLVHAVTIMVQPGGYSPSTLEVAYALAMQLQVPRYSFRVTRLSSVSFVADFAFAPARDRAVLKGSITISGSPLLINPWRSAGNAADKTWWFHAKVTMENVPLEAWNEDGVKLILGDACIFDKFDRRTAAADRESSQFLTCWVWMETPDALPRAMEYWFFAARAGQAMELLGLPSSVPSTPPTGKFGGKVILIHLEGYEDWSPQSPRSSSSETSSEHGSSAPTFVPHEWAAGVLDGRPTQARPLPPRNGGCRAPAAPQKRRDNDPDNDREGPHRRHDAPRSSRVRQLFPGCASDRSVRVQSRSPHPYRRAAGTPELEDLERGRTPCRSLQRSLRARDIIPHAADDWERRRSRSPGCRGQCVAASCNDYMGSLDPLADLCLRASPAWSPPRGSDDPMILEASYLDSVPTAPDDAHVAPQSPAYIPVSALWWGNKQTNCTPTVQDEIVFGPGVQQQEPGGSQAGSMDEVGVISGLVTKMDIDTATERGPTAAAMTSSPAGVPLPPPENQQPPNLYTGLFCELPAPVLQAPAPGEPAPRARKMKKPTVSTRSSSRLAARPSAVPVAQRAQRKLMQELSFIDNNQQQAPDAAVTEYLDLYADDLPEQAVKAIQTAARLGNKRLVKILEAVVQEADALEMET